MGNINKSVIAKYVNRNLVGYVKNISYVNGKHTITKDRNNAKGYTSPEKMFYDMDFLTKTDKLGSVFIEG